MGIMLSKLSDFSKEVEKIGDSLQSPYRGDLTKLTQHVRDLAIEAGRENKPLTSEVAPDINENEIGHAAFHVVSALDAHYSKRIRNQEGQLTQLQTHIEDSSFELELPQELGRARIDLDQLFANNKAELINLKKKDLELSAVLTAFKKIHGRTQPAHYPLSTLAHYYVIAAMALVEALFNIGFYSQQKGIGMALVIAIVAAIVNVGVSTFAGTVWRRKNHFLSSGQRFLGWTAFGAWSLYAFGLNKFLSIFRAEMERLALDGGSIDPTGPASRVAFDATFGWLTNGFVALDMMSWCLFIMGSMVSAAAFLKGYYGDDTYPNYGAISRLHIEAQENFQELEQNIRKNAAQIIHKVDANILRVEEEKKKALSDFKSMLHLVDRTHQENVRDVNGVKADYNNLITCYREANKSISSTPRPNYFEIPPALNANYVLITDRWIGSSASENKARLESYVRTAFDICMTNKKALAEIDIETARMMDAQFISISEMATRSAGGFSLAVG